MSLMGPATINALSGFPRVSGDEPTAVSQLIHFLRFSPRERG